MADLAAARREAEEALHEWGIENERANSERRQMALYACASALRSLLAASPEPATALPDEVCACADKVDTGHTLQCREPGPPRHRVAPGGRS